MIQLLLGIGWTGASILALIYAHARYDHKSELVRYAIGLGVVMGCLLGWAWSVEQAAGIRLAAIELTLAAVGMCIASGVAVGLAHEEDKTKLREQTKESGYPPLDQEP